MARRLNHVMQVRLDEDQYGALERISARNDTTLGGAVRVLLDHWLDDRAEPQHPSMRELMNEDDGVLELADGRRFVLETVEPL